MAIKLVILISILLLIIVLLSMTIWWHGIRNKMLLLDLVLRW